MRPHRPTVRGLLPRLLPLALVAAPLSVLAAPHDDVALNPAKAATAATAGANQGFSSLEAETGTLLGGASAVTLSRC